MLMTMTKHFDYSLVSVTENRYKFQSPCTKIKQQQQQQQSQQKPKPPVRVQSMQNQQKPEVSPKPKNLLNKSNTVTSSSMNLKPVLARYQPQLIAFQQPQPKQTNHSESSSPMTNSLPPKASINHNQMIDRKF
ncbi:hypothetical protein HUG17_6890 [Dermatophagoides farinae]|uniref:Uncharacterized protein n=1 Tax=Dermatophagoides farinae TaxID=6954 RepID=A0A9D4SC11_DERFA|nr:myb-like protein AA [Dermatophagoides farinae]KAH7636684.1 hypothetical protein HUG17_6890 [Dermatophagoides farinae]